MGTWNAGIFDDDLTMDIRDEFEEYMEEGMNVKAATKQILESYEDVLDDEDEAPLVYLSLAALQLEKGAVQKNIKEKTLKIIEKGQGLERWEEAGEDVLNERKGVLNDLKNKLVQSTV